MCVREDDKVSRVCVCVSVGCLRLGVISLLGAYVKCQSDTFDFHDKDLETACLCAGERYRFKADHSLAIGDRYVSKLCVLLS